MNRYSTSHGDDGMTHVTVNGCEWIASFYDSQFAFKWIEDQLKEELRHVRASEKRGFMYKLLHMRDTNSKLDDASKWVH